MFTGNLRGHFKPLSQIYCITMTTIKASVRKVSNKYKAHLGQTKISLLKLFVTPATFL